MTQHQVMLIMLSILLGYLVFGDITHKLTGDYPKVVCVEKEGKP